MKLIPGISILFAVSAVLFLLAEGTARLVLWRRTPAAMVFDPDIVYSFKPHSQAYGIRFNNIGCIGSDVPNEKRKDELRVLLLGGSTSFSQDYVDKLENELSLKLPKNYSRVQVLSCGRPRYTSEVNRAMLAKLSRTLQPDIVGLYLGINDNVYNTYRWLDGLPEVGFFDYRNTKVSSFLDLLNYYVIKKPLLSTPEFSTLPLRSSKIFRRNLDHMSLIAEENNFKIATASFALGLPSSDKALERKVMSEEPLMQHFWGNIQSTLLGVNEHNETLREWANREGIVLAEFSEIVPKDSKHFSDICHLTEDGYSVLASQMSEAILTSLPPEY